MCQPGRSGFPGSSNAWHRQHHPRLPAAGPGQPSAHGQGMSAGRGRIRLLTVLVANHFNDARTANQIAAEGLRDTPAREPDRQSGTRHRNGTGRACWRLSGHRVSVAGERMRNLRLHRGQLRMPGRSCCGAASEATRNPETQGTVPPAPPGDRRTAPGGTTRANARFKG